MKPWHYFLILLLLLACEERFNDPLNTRPTNLLVVEAVLTNELVPQKINLSFPYQQLNGAPTPATGAVVQVVENDAVIYSFYENILQPGEYISAPFRAVFGEEYKLEIQIQGKEYYATDSSVPVEPLTPLQYKMVNNQFELVLYETGTISNYIDHTITSEDNSGCMPCLGRVIFYDLKSIDVNEIYKPGKKSFLFPAGSTIIRRKYSVSASYRTYLRSMLSETEWRGGIFDVDRANVATNLSTGATGFFAVSTVISDTTVVE